MTGVELIAAERQRQMSEEGWTSEHDDEHDDGEMAVAAVCYAAPDLVYVRADFANAVCFEDPWPWQDQWDKREYDGNELVPNSRLSKKKRIRNLVKAGALIAAEIDRLQRAAARGEE